jgi:hypothetical protein
MAPAGEASTTWRAIEHGVQLLKYGVIHRIDDGQATRVWRDNWLPRSPSMKPSGAVRTCRLRRVAQLMRPGTNERDEDTLRRFFYPWDVVEILKIKLPENKTPDLIAWHYEKTGLFSVRSAHRLALTRATDLDAMGSSSDPRGERAIWKKTWKMPVLAKGRNLIWKMVRSGLPTNENRCYRHITQDVSCELCYTPCEDCFHAVMTCPHAKALKIAMREVWDLPPEERLHNAGPEWFLCCWTCTGWRK